MYDIVWDTDGKSLSLPSEVDVACVDIESIADALSYAYGWLVVDFKVARCAEVDTPILIDRGGSLV